MFENVTQVRTLSNVTRSAACNSVSCEMSSTILDNLGSAGDDVDEDAAGVAAFKHLAELPNDLRTWL